MMFELKESRMFIWTVFSCQHCVGNKTEVYAKESLVDHFAITFESVFKRLINVNVCRRRMTPV